MRGMQERVHAYGLGLDRLRAARPLEQLALSPQCGFASTEEGNVLTEEQQWAKMREVVEVAEEVWGK